MNCQYCSLVFDSKSKLDRHLNRVKPCYIEQISDKSLACHLCNNVFANLSNLKRHIEICPIKRNPDMLIIQLDKHKEIINQKQEIITQKDELIKQLQQNIDANAGANMEDCMDVSGNENTINNTTNNTTNNNTNSNNTTNNNTTNNTTNNNNNNNISISLDNDGKIKPYPFRSETMKKVIEKVFEENEKDAKKLCIDIKYHAERGDMKNVLVSLLKYFHNNSKFKRGHNLYYCVETDQYMTYNPDPKVGFDGWYITKPFPILKTLSQELLKIRSFQEGYRMLEETDKKKKANMDKYLIDSRNLESDDIHIEYIKDIISKFDQIQKPKVINDKTIKTNIPRDTVIPQEMVDDEKIILFDDSDDDSADTNEQKRDGTRVKKGKIVSDNDDNPEDDDPKIVQKNKEKAEKDRLFEENRQKRKQQEKEREAKFEEIVKLGMEKIDIQAKFSKKLRKDPKTDIDVFLDELIKELRDKI